MLFGLGRRLTMINEGRKCHGTKSYGGRFPRSHTYPRSYQRSEFYTRIQSPCPLNVHRHSIWKRRCPSSNPPALHHSPHSPPSQFDSSPPSSAVSSKILCLLSRLWTYGLNISTRTRNYLTPSIDHQIPINQPTFLSVNHLP